MNAAMARGAEAYRQTEVQSRSPLELVVMLYDGALRFIGEAREAIERHDLPAKRGAMSRALAVVSELQSTLNLAEGGQVAASLDGLYTYVNGRLLDANMKGDVAALDECVRLITPLRDAWTQVAAAAPADGTARP